MAEIQLIVNTSLLREIDSSKLLTYYGKHCYFSEEDLMDDIKIRSNLEDLLDWDKNGDLGLALYCSKFESLKRSDIERLVKFIKNNTKEIRERSKSFIKLKKLENKKIIQDRETKIEEKRKAHFCDENYKVNPYGKKAKPTIYEGRVYRSRQEAMYKEGITKNQLYQYLKKHEGS